jgi:hypothetical protein
MKKKFYTAIAIVAFIGLSNATFAQSHQRYNEGNQRGNDQTARVENNQFNGGGDYNTHYVNGSRQEDQHFNNEENRGDYNNHYVNDSRQEDRRFNHDENRRDDHRWDNNSRSEHGRFNREENRCDRRF